MSMWSFLLKIFISRKVINEVQTIMWICNLSLSIKCGTSIYIPGIRDWYVHTWYMYVHAWHMCIHPWYSVQIHTKLCAHVYPWVWNSHRNWKKSCLKVCQRQKRPGGLLELRGWGGKGYEMGGGGCCSFFHYTGQTKTTTAQRRHSSARQRSRTDMLSRAPGPTYIRAQWVSTVLRTCMIATARYGRARNQPLFLLKVGLGYFWFLHA